MVWDVGGFLIRAPAIGLPTNIPGYYSILPFNLTHATEIPHFLMSATVLLLVQGIPTFYVKKKLDFYTPLFEYLG